MTFLLETMRAHADSEAVACDTTVTTYQNLLTHVAAWQDRFSHARLRPGAVVGMDGHYNAQTLSLLLALMQHRAIIVPLSREAQSHHHEFCDIAQVEYHIRMTGATPTIEQTGRHAQHPLYDALHKRETSGLVLFSSGSTGKSKAMVHDLHLLLRKFQQPRRRWRTLLFLGLDHIGGINTLFYTLSNGGMAVVPVDRSPSGVCQAIQQHRVELLPTSPTFLNFLLLSGAYKVIRLVVIAADYLWHRAHAAEHARPDSPGFSSGDTAADLRPVGVRHSPVQITRLDVAVGAPRRGGVSDESCRQPAMDQSGVDHARLPQCGWLVR